MIKYYPLTRIKPNLYTRGSEFATPDGKPYRGKYYITFDNQAFTGINPVLGTNIPLTKIPQRATASVASIQYTSAASQNQTKIVTESDVTLRELTSYYPIVTESDYALGYFTRYFAKYVTGPGYIIEISQGEYAAIKNIAEPINMLSYEVTEMLWQLTGPKNDTRVSQYQIKGGVYDTNKRVTEAKEATFKGIISYIGGDYTKFARLT